jgi:hypothetical protein
MTGLKGFLGIYGCQRGHLRGILLFAGKHSVWSFANWSNVANSCVLRKKNSLSVPPYSFSVKKRLIPATVTVIAGQCQKPKSSSHRTKRC